MTENKDKIIDKDRDKKTENEMVSDKIKEASHDNKELQQQNNQTTKEQQQEQQQQQPQQHDRYRRLTQFLVLLNIPRHHFHNHHHHHTNTTATTPNNQQHNNRHSSSVGGGHSNASSNTTSQQHSPLTPHAPVAPAVVTSSSSSLVNAACQLTITASNGCNNQNSSSTTSLAINTHPAVVVNDLSEEPHMQELHASPQLPNSHNLPRSSCASFQSESLILDLINGDLNEFVERAVHKDEFGTQRVYKKTSPNCVLTLYLPSREICLSGSSPSVMRGIVFVDPKAIQGYRVYAQLTLTFRYGREDEEVMGLRFCNEAIMSLHQIWPRNEEPNKESLSPLQEALLKRLGEGAHPFTLTLTAQAPPSVQLVPAKRYYGAPIGTSYDVRCFIADKSDDKFHRRASVKMGVRVIYRTDVFSHGITGPENFAALVNNPLASPPPQALNMTTAPTSTTTPSSSLSTHTTISENQSIDTDASNMPTETSLQAIHSTENRCFAKVRKSDRGDSFPKLRLSPKAFRFSSRFGRSKSEVEKCPNDPFHNYSKSFQEYDSVCPPTSGGGGPQGAVDKPFLLQDGRVGLRASLDKSWYTHGEDVCVTINIRNDSRKTVRKVRVCAIQHVDVCMFNNGKFKNVVADSDALSPPPVEQHVAPGCTLNSTVILKPQRGATKNWIALEDTLQRSTEPDEINADIAASALRTPHFLMQASHSPNKCSSPGVLIPPTALTNALSHHAPTNSDERNVFAIYVSYYVKVKLTLSGMGGELSLKLPFLLVHIDEEQRLKHEKQKIQLEAVPALKRNGVSFKSRQNNNIETTQNIEKPKSLDRIESLDADNVHIKVTHVSSCDGDGVVEAAINAEAEDEIAEEPQPSTSLACQRRRRSFMRCESIDHGLEDDTVEAKPLDLEKVLHVAQVHTETVKEETENPSENENKS